MTIWLDADSRILVQGMTGSEGTKHTRRMVASGAKVVAGVTPGKGGQEVDGIPVFGDVREAMVATGANVSVVFVPPRFAKAAWLSVLPEFNLDRKHKDIDAVSIASPNHQHSIQGIWSLQAGKHLYVEKPLSHNIFEGQQLVAASNHFSKLVVQAGTQSRSGVGIRAAIKDAAAQMRKA